ncbi:hypothetical protein MRB53_000262 [Persea americana]|uniref:Uncharacterized protein n=1 Tax=Persea americana TaxID=3435 RepID=A0ACC2MNL1_PERAE|nr:hypothetical protein MRB53_000262 [Persea americana]
MWRGCGDYGERKQWVGESKPDSLFPLLEHNEPKKNQTSVFPSPTSFTETSYRNRSSTEEEMEEPEEEEMGRVSSNGKWFGRGKN